MGIKPFAVARFPIPIIVETVCTCTCR